MYLFRIRTKNIGQFRGGQDDCSHDQGGRHSAELVWEGDLCKRAFGTMHIAKIVHSKKIFIQSSLDLPPLDIPPPLFIATYLAGTDFRLLFYIWLSPTSFTAIRQASVCTKTRNESKISLDLPPTTESRLRFAYVRVPNVNLFLEFTANHGCLDVYVLRMY